MATQKEHLKRMESMLFHNVSHLSEAAKVFPETPKPAFAKTIRADPRRISRFWSLKQLCDHILGMLFGAPFAFHAQIMKHKHDSYM